MDGYLLNRLRHTDVSMTKRMLAATDDQTLISAPKASETIFIQRITLSITTGSATTWAFIDNASVPITTFDVTNVGFYERDFGPEGIPLTLAQSFVLNVGAVGAAGWITVEAYKKRTAVAAA